MPANGRRDLIRRLKVNFIQITGNSSEVILKIIRVTKLDINYGTIIEIQRRKLF